MAKATTAGITLELTLEEARTLLYITNQVGGPPEGRRGHMDAIGSALSSAGVSAPVSGDSDSPADFKLVCNLAAVYFEN